MNWKEMLSYYSLTQLPFGKEISTESLQLLPSVENNLAAARLLVDTHGIGVMVGKSGTGKSCLLRLLVSRLPAGLFKPLYLCHTSVGILEFYTHLCALFGLSSSCRRAVMFHDIQAHILSMNSSRHLHPVLLIDEAHLLSNEILAEIRLLTNFHIDSLNALTVMLCGAETLSLRFGLSMLEALANSITVTIPLEGLPPEESISFIEGRLSWSTDASVYQECPHPGSSGFRQHPSYHRHHRKRCAIQGFRCQEHSGGGRACTVRGATISLLKRELCSGTRQKTGREPGNPADYSAAAKNSDSDRLTVCFGRSYYVFAGDGNRPYVEHDPNNPLGAYGWTKVGAA